MLGKSVQIFALPMQQPPISGRSTTQRAYSIPLQCTDSLGYPRWKHKRQLQTRGSICRYMQRLPASFNFDLMFQAYCTMSLKDNISVTTELQLKFHNFRPDTAYACPWRTRFCGNPWALRLLLQLTGTAA